MSSRQIRLWRRHAIGAIAFLLMTNASAAGQVVAVTARLINIPSLKKVDDLVFTTLSIKGEDSDQIVLSSAGKVMGLSNNSELTPAHFSVVQGATSTVAITLPNHSVLYDKSGQSIYINNFTKGMSQTTAENTDFSVGGTVTSAKNIKNGYYVGNFLIVAEYN